MSLIRRILWWIWKIPVFLSYGLISLYQHTLSPDHGLLRFFFRHGYCRFHPTCSQYTKEAIVKYGFIKGVFKGVKRISRCNPWNEGGVDYP